MKLLELLKNQEINIQLMWDKEKIEFTAVVVDFDANSVYVTPYLHNGKELTLNVTGNTEVVCNMYANDNITHKRIAWKGIDLTTVNREGKIVYCVKTHAFNNASTNEDRRDHERILVHVDARVFGEDTSESVTIHDISDTGMGIYAPLDFEPKSRQLTVYFSDNIGEKIFSFKLVCDIARIANENGNLIIGCRLLGENRDYQVYEFMKRLKSKYGNVFNESKKDDSDNNSESSVDNQEEVKKEHSDKICA